MNDYSSSKVGKCHVSAAVVECYTPGQRYVHIHSKKNVPGSNVGITWLQIYPNWLDIE